MSDKQIIEGEIVDQSAEVSLADGTLDTSATINSLISRIDDLKVSTGKLKDMLDSIFANDPTYELHDAAAKEASKVRNQTKKQILRLPQALDLNNKILDKKALLKDLQNDLSSYLSDYSRTTGFTTFESANGELLEIIVDYRFRKVSQKS